MSTFSPRRIDAATRGDILGALAAVLGAAAAAFVCGALIGSGHVALVCAAVLGSAACAAVVAQPERSALLLVACVPFLIYPISVGSLSVFLGLPFGLLVAVALLMRALAGEARRPPVLPALAFGALLGIGSLSAAVSVDPTTAASRVLYLVMFGLLAAALAHAIAAGLITREALVKAIVIGAAAAAAVLTVQSLAQFVVGRESVYDWLVSVSRTFGGKRSAGTEQDANWYVPSVRMLRGVFPFMTSPSAGQYMMLGLIAAVWLRRERRDAGRIALRLDSIAVVLIATGLVLTLSRQAWVGAIVGVVLLSLEPRRIRMTIVIACAGIAVALLPLPNGSGQTFGDYLMASRETGAKSNAERVGLWRQAIDLTRDNPVLGAGPGLIGTLNPDTSNKVFYAHNIVLDASVETGVPGAVALVAVLIGGMGIAWRNKQRLALALIAAYVVANMFDDVLYFPRNGILMAAAFAIAAVPLRPRATAASVDAAPRALESAAAGPSPAAAAAPPSAAVPAPAVPPPAITPAPAPTSRAPGRAQREPEAAVLMLGKGWFPDQEGGLNRYFRNLFEASHRARAVVVGPASSAPATVKPIAAHEDSLAGRLLPFTRAALLAARGADVVNAHFPLYAFLPIAAGLRGKPLVTHFHGPWADEARAAGRASRGKAAVERAIERRVYRRADAVIVLSNAFRDVLVDRYDVRPEKVTVVRPGVDLKLFSPGPADDARRRLGLEPGRPVVVTARRLVPRMGIDVLIDAWARVSDGTASDQRPLLLVIGDGPERPRLEAQARDRGLGDDILFLGKVSDEALVAAYRAAHLAVAPSVALEGFGLVTLEALACGTPVVATRVGGLPEALEDLDASLIVPPGDPAALADRLRGALSGEVPVPSRERCRHYAEGFTWERTAREVQTVYRAVADGTRRG